MPDAKAPGLQPRRQNKNVLRAIALGYLLLPPPALCSCRYAGRSENGTETIRDSFEWGTKRVDAVCAHTEPEAPQQEGGASRKAHLFDEEVVDTRVAPLQPIILPSAKYMLSQNQGAEIEPQFSVKRSTTNLKKVGAGEL